MRCYIALLHKDADRYRIEFPDFPGCGAWAETLHDAPRVALGILAEEIALRRAAGHPIPRPSEPEALAASAARSGAVPVVVPAPIPLADRARTRVSVSVDLPAGLVERVDRRARIHGVGRSDILEKATRLALWETGRFAGAAASGRVGK